MKTHNEYNPRNPKIDVTYDGVYLYSTNWHRTCKQAKADHLAKNPKHDNKRVKAKKDHNACYKH